jgi:hypothetical protein
MKNFKTFHHLVTHDYTYKIGYGPTDDDLAAIEIPETQAPILNLNLTPMPAVCRYKNRKASKEKNVYFLLDDAVKLA